MGSRALTAAWAAVALGSGAVGACGPPLRPDPFLVSPNALRRLTEPVALAPTLVSEGLAVPESVAAYVDRLVADAMSGAGIPTVPADEFADLWGRILDEVGGVVHPTSGERDSLRHADAMDLLRDELWQRYGAGSILYPELVVVAASLSGGKARWDGTSQYVSRTGVWGDLFMLLRGRTPLEGWVDALSLWVTIETTAGVEIYASAGGIQVLEYIDEASLRFMPIPSERIGDAPDRIARAARYALAPLLDSLGRTVP